MIIHIPASLTGEAVVKRAMFLAYNAALVMGTGHLQAKNNATEDEVWHRVVTAGDYPGQTAQPTNNPERVKISADYVFGRMMKLHLAFGPSTVTIPDEAPRKDYQSWCHAIPTFGELINRAVNQLVKEKTDAARS